MCGTAGGGKIRINLRSEWSCVEHGYMKYVASVNAEIISGPNLIIEVYEGLPGR